MPSHTESSAMLTDLSEKTSYDIQQGKALARDPNWDVLKHFFNSIRAASRPLCLSFRPSAQLKVHAATTSIFVGRKRTHQRLPPSLPTGGYIILRFISSKGEHSTARGSADPIETYCALSCFSPHWLPRSPEAQQEKSYPLSSNASTSNLPKGM